MAIEVSFRDPRTNRVKLVKVGWSWTLFLFSGFFGLPLFFRGLYAWGIALLFSWFVLQVVQHTAPFGLLWFLTTGVLIAVAIYLGVKGNELSAKQYLSRGWDFAEPTSDATRFGKLKWGLGELPPQPGNQPVRIEPTF